MIPIQYALRRRMMRQASLLPSGYTRVDYIQGTGSQYIDTGFLVNKNDNYALEVDAAFDSQTQAYQGCNGYMQFYVSSVYGISADSTKAVGNRDIVKIAYANQTAVLSVNDIQIESKSWASYSGADVKLGILRMGDTNNGWFSGGVASGTIYGYKILKNNVLASECIPCMRNSDGVAGMYDVIREQFITNAGNGAFKFPVILPFGLKYSGDAEHTINDNKHIVKLLSSGILTVKGSITSEVYMLAGGGGAAYALSGWDKACSGGGGGYDTFTTKLEPGDYPITIGTGGFAVNNSQVQSGLQVTGGTGGDTIAFGRTCTGGTGSTAGASASVGKGGSPNGENGQRINVSGFDPITVPGGAPNGGKLEVIRNSSQQAYSGGDGYITLTIPV